ncbi:hypothetical protein EW026_g447 [Hermanssonia centrifuga]|uniref:Peroxisome assembly protein 12 n=1 Tax=Hermanssonia centrifuga TaxID=98765 RepID=A0A4S4KV32_9APHY|nr:hypothetical protein EW026_g447 [Hermanssonia centrifuga]
MEIDEAEEDQPVSPSTYRRESLAFLAQRFFEWLGSIEEEVSSPSAMNEETLGFKRRCTLRLSRELGSSNEDSELVWEWTENLTSTGDYIFVSNDPLKPSLFELVAQEQLRDLLQPALKYVLSVFAQRYPRYLIRIVNRHEEFYAALMFFVERHYLRTHGASFAENFYGLKRRRTPVFETERARAAVGGVPDEEKLRGREMWRSLVLLIGIPYLRAKAQDYFEALGGGVDPDILDENAATQQQRALTEENMVANLRRAFKVVYPWINLTFELWLLLYNIAYLFEKTPFYRPWLGWVGVDIRRLGVDDMRAARLATQRKSPIPDISKGLLTRLRRMLLSSPRLLLDSLKVLLPTAIFFVKFLEWWYSPSSPARALSVSPLGPAVPPPRLLSPHPLGLRIDPIKYGECGLCHEQIANATAFPSGYVFCYRCAYDYVQKHGKCPVTLLPARVWQLRKILV